MSKKIVFCGTKGKMTRIFEENGVSVPVTLVTLEDSLVVDIKNDQDHGYKAVLVVTGSRSVSRLNKAEIGLCKKYSLKSFSKIYEIRRRDEDQFVLPEINETLSIDIIEKGIKVDLTGRSKGKGFAGGVKRWNFRTQDASHGNSLSHRVLGSIGGNQPGRVWRGKKMAGHMGHEQVKISNREIVAIDKENKLIAIKGSVPGPSGSLLWVSCKINLV